ncbi:MAG: ABC transporter permease [Halorhabdus sp.]
MSRDLNRLRAIVGLTLQQLRHDRLRTIMAVLGVTLAVLATTLLASTGYGVMETGAEKFDSSGRDLWVTGGPVQFAPGSVGGFENTILDSHTLANNISRWERVRTAEPLAFQTVYVGTDPSELDTIVGVGVRGTGEQGISTTAGQPFVGPDVHYAGGNYSGPMTREVIVDQNTAETYNLSINDTIHVGGTLLSARENEYRIVGISPTFSRFLGTSTVVVRLSELQELTGTTRTDRATMLTIDVHEGENVTAVKQRIERTYPNLDVRTNREQLQRVLQQKLAVIASGVTLVVLAVISGLALTVNLMALLVFQQRREIAAAKALGISSRTLMGMTAGQGIIIGFLGGGVGLLLTPVFARVLNILAYEIVGFQGLVRVPNTVYIGAAGLALVMGLLGAVVAGWRIARLQPTEQLRS